METGHAKGLIQAIQAFRNVYDHEHQHLPPVERESGWQQYWDSISAQAVNSAGSIPVIPAKRSASNSFIGEEPFPKRAGLENLVVDTPTHPLQRQYSAPAYLRTTREVPFDVSGRHDFSTTSTSATPTYSFTRTGLGDIDELQDLSPSEYLELSQSQFCTHSLTPSPGVEGGEFNDQNTSDLTYHEAYEPSAPQPPMATISDSSLISRSVALSEPMTRSNTDDVLCKGVDMIRMSSMSKPSHSVLGKSDDLDDQALPLSYPTMVPSQYHEISYSTSPLPISYISEMTASLSQESYGSSSSGSNDSSPRMQESPTSSGRRLAPKLESDKSLPVTDITRYIEVKDEDGTVKRKAEITRAKRREPERKTLKCPYCDENRTGFHGVHELDRHIGRHHNLRRKVWICKEKDQNGTFLANCKACRNKKTYGANYNAAAHLRRAHFNPPKNKRGGRGKKSEGRGGMGGGKEPKMDELKHWMYEVWEENTTSNVLAHETPVDVESMEAYQAYGIVHSDFDGLAYPQDTMFMSPIMHQHQQPQQPMMYGIPPTTMAGHQPVPPSYHSQWAPPVY